MVGKREARRPLSSSSPLLSGLTEIGASRPVLPELATPTWALPPLLASQGRKECPQGAAGSGQWSQHLVLKGQLSREGRKKEERGGRRVAPCANPKDGERTDTCAHGPRLSQLFAHICGCPCVCARAHHLRAENHTHAHTHTLGTHWPTQSLSLIPI